MENGAAQASQGNMGKHGDRGDVPRFSWSSFAVFEAWAIVNRFAQVGQSMVPAGPLTIARQFTGGKLPPMRTASRRDA